MNLCRWVWGCSLSFVLAGVALAQPPPATAVAPRVLTHEDLWLMPRVGPPQPSPDGKWVVMLVTEPAYDPAEQQADLWLVAADGTGHARRITATKGTETGVDWSPDSTRLVFAAKRDGDDAPQLYTLDLARGGEAVRLTTLSTGVRSPRWSPDGSRLLFSSDVYPDAGDDAANRSAAQARKERKTSARVYESFPIRYWDKWLDDRKAHPFVVEARPGAVPRDLLVGTQLAALPGFGGRETESGQSLDATWAPDGQSVVFVASTGRDRAAFDWVDAALFAVPVAGGEPTRLTAIDDAASYSQPVFAPEGGAVLVRRTPAADGRTYRLSRLVRYPWPFSTSAAQVLTAEFDRVPSEPVWSGDGRTVFFTAEDDGYERLFRVPAEGGRAELAFPSPGGVVTGLAGGGTGRGFRLFSAWEDATRPPEIFALDPAAREARPQPLTRFTAEKRAALDLPALESFSFDAPTGRRVQSFLVRPPGFDPAKKYPVIALLHGGPHTMFRDAWVLRWNYHLLAAPGYCLVLTNYAGSTGFGEAFAQTIQGDPLAGPATEINAAVDEALRLYPFLDGTRLAAGGASYGGHLANWLQATTTRYRCLIAHAGLVSLESQWATSDVIYARELVNGGPVWEQGPIWREQSPARLAGRHATKTGWVTPMLLSVGEQDFRVPLNNTLENWSYHQRLQIPGKLIVFPDENHWILKGHNSRFWYGEVHAWLERWLRP